MRFFRPAQAYGTCLDAGTLHVRLLQLILKMLVYDAIRFRTISDRHFYGSSGQQFEPAIFLNQNNEINLAARGDHASQYLRHGHTFPHMLSSTTGISFRCSYAFVSR
jgi:hypothetical protein